MGQFLVNIWSLSVKMSVKTDQKPTQNVLTTVTDTGITRPVAKQSMDLVEETLSDLDMTDQDLASWIATQPQLLESKA